MEKILVPIDMHEESSWGKVIPAAVDEAKQHDSELYIMTVVPQIELGMPGVPNPEDINKIWQQDMLNRLKATAKDIIPEDVKVQCVLGVGSVADAIIDMAEDIDASLIVMASHKPTLKTYLLGANAAQVARHAKCSVYIVRCH